jgi:hypothetical protein
MHRLSTSFVLGYHGCDRTVGERLLAGEPFRASANEYDWLGPGIYFWESNPLRGLHFARESASRKGSGIADPFVIGAVIELGLCLDLTTKGGLELVKFAHQSLVQVAAAANEPLPDNSPDGMRRNLDCAVIRRLHSILSDNGQPANETVKGVFIEGDPLYAGSGFREKTHIQIAVCHPECIRGVFRVPKEQLVEEV